MKKINLTALKFWRRSPGAKLGNFPNPYRDWRRLVFVWFILVGMLFGAAALSYPVIISPRAESPELTATSTAPVLAPADLERVMKELVAREEAFANPELPAELTIDPGL